MEVPFALGAVGAFGRGGGGCTGVEGACAPLALGWRPDTALDSAVMMFFISASSVLI